MIQKHIIKVKANNCPICNYPMEIIGEKINEAYSTNVIKVIQKCLSCEARTLIDYEIKFEIGD